MVAFRFDAGSRDSSASAVSPRRQLYGYLTLPKSGGPSNEAVLLCNPFGQKAVRTHRLYRVLSERFARIGLASMRFDYYGSGDSDGEDAELNVSTCMSDILRADEELRDRTGCNRINWVGLRFGATVAALASSRAKNRPDRLIMWDPIEDGAAWMQQLREEHLMARKALFSSTGQGADNQSINPGDLNAKGGFESQGFVVSALMQDAITRIGIQSYLSVRCSRLVVLAAGDHQQASLQAIEAAPDILSFDLQKVAPGQWNTDEAMNASLVPGDVVGILLAELAGGGR